MNPPPNPAAAQARAAMQTYSATVKPPCAPREIILVTFLGHHDPTLPDAEIAAMLAAHVPDITLCGARLLNGKIEWLTADQVRENNRAWQEEQPQ